MKPLMVPCSCLATAPGCKCLTVPVQSAAASPLSSSTLPAGAGQMTWLLDLQEFSYRNAPPMSHAICEQPSLLYGACTASATPFAFEAHQRCDTCLCPCTSRFLPQQRLHLAHCRPSAIHHAVCSHHQDSPESLPRAARVGGLLQPAKAVLIHLEGELVCLLASCVFGSRSAAASGLQATAWASCAITNAASGQRQLSAAPAAVKGCCCLLLSGDTHGLAAMTCCCHAADPRVLEAAQPPVACGLQSLPAAVSAGFELAPQMCNQAGWSPGALDFVHTDNWQYVNASLTMEHAMHLCGPDGHAAPSPSCDHGVKQSDRLQAFR